MHYILEQTVTMIQPFPARVSFVLIGLITGFVILSCIYFNTTPLTTNLKNWRESLVEMSQREDRQQSIEGNRQNQQVEYCIGVLIIWNRTRSFITKIKLSWRDAKNTLETSNDQQDIFVLHLVSIFWETSVWYQKIWNF